MPVQLPIREHSQLQPMAATPASTASSIIDFLPDRLVLYLAAPYLAGKNFSEALRRAFELYEGHRFWGTLDILGEDSASAQECDAIVASYLKVIEAVEVVGFTGQADRQKTSVSMKPSMFATAAPGSDRQSKRQLEGAFERIKTVVDYAHKRQVAITLEAEDSRWTDFHLDTYFALTEAGYGNLGTVLQTRLFRTKEDIKRFEKGMRVRLVIGIYKEPAAIAYEDKAKMKDLLVAYAAKLFGQGVYVEVATHDNKCIEKFVEQVVLPETISASQFEFQFLLGVPRLELEKALVSGDYFRSLAPSLSADGEAHRKALSESGALVRIYLPFGENRVAAPYCKRRLKNNPNMISYGIKNWLRLQS